MKPRGVATVKVHRNGSTEELKIQIVDKTNKPLLSAEACERLGLVKVMVAESYASE